MPPRHVTLHDVAREAGVHPATVSRALSPDKQVMVNAETLARVRAVAKRLGYVADPVAQALRGGTLRQIGVLVRTLEHPWVGAFLRGIDEELSGAGYNPWITYTGDDPERVRMVVGVMTSWRAGGLIVATARVPDEVIVEATETGIPVVAVGRSAPAQACSVVEADNEGGTRTAVGHLMRLGHTRIAYVAGPQDIPIMRPRLRGFSDAMSDSGLGPDPQLIKHARYDAIEEGEASCRELIAEGHRMTAIAAGNDQLAIGCYVALRAAGLRIPEDVSVIGFDDLPLTEYLGPPLSTMHYPGYEMGVEAANLIMSQMRATSTAASMATRTVLLGTELMARESTAQARD
jgi:LacI family transcriptional regulator